MTAGFWQGKRVLLTGHTGFKGAWMALWLEKLGASVTGYSLEPATDPALFRILEPWPQLTSVINDIRNSAALAATVAKAEPELVIHMAAQALVRPSYADPVETFSTNAMGTIQLLEVLRSAPRLRVVLVITSDKVYRHDGPDHHFVETDHLGGSDPYSASKAVQELVTASYAASYFDASDIQVATARAGNVIGGGDWAADRLIPDYFRSVRSGAEFQLRYPGATRPWQHVLEPLSGYLTYMEHLYEGRDVPRSLNFGPDEPPLAVYDIVEKLATAAGHPGRWRRQDGELWPEHAALQLDSTTATKVLGWRPRLDIDQAVELTAHWYRAHEAGEDMRRLSLDQINSYAELMT